MPFMSLHITPKGALYTADCRKCGATVYVHEWAHPDPNGARDAMQSPSGLACDQCHGATDPDTFTDHGRKHYAARYSADGYMDCTDWNYGTNKRALIRETRALYGDC